MESWLSLTRKSAISLSFAFVGWIPIETACQPVTSSG